MLRAPEATRDGYAFAFTKHDTPALRARIAADLDRVVAGIRASDRAVTAVALTGGFSRGEGTARDDRPLNDYDLVVVRSRPGARARYRELGHALSARLGLEVDLLPIWRARVPRVGHKLFWLDLKLGGRVLDGDPGALDALPPLDAATLSPLEPARLLGNRAAGLLQAIPGPDEPGDDEQRDLQATKAAIAAMDASLLASGRYAPRLEDRLLLSRAHPDYDIFKTAVQWKLGGSRASSANAWWGDARDALLRAVDRIGARRARDGAEEVLVHAALARRLRVQPSAAVREAAWNILRISAYPEGPDPDEAARVLSRVGRVTARAWSQQKAAFFAMRARTLQ